MAVAPGTLVTPAMWQGGKAQLRARFVGPGRVGGPEHEATVELLFPVSTTSEPVARSHAGLRPQDGKLERGRAIGLVLAELLRESPGSAFTDATAATAASAGPSTESSLPGPWRRSERGHGRQLGGWGPG